jgi:hypothetical protein
MAADLKPGIYQLVRDWVVNGGPVNSGAFTDRPRLFCHHDYWKLQKMNDWALDDNGQYIFDEPSGRQIKIKNILFYRTQQAALATSLKVGLSDIYPVS